MTKIVQRLFYELIPFRAPETVLAYIRALLTSEIPFLCCLR